MIEVGNRTVGTSEFLDELSFLRDALHRLIDRGRSAGEFRSDLPREWLVHVLDSLTTSAFSAIESGAGSSEDAPDLIVSTSLVILGVATTSVRN